MMAHDVHPNPMPQTARPPDELTYMTLNVGGPRGRKRGRPDEWKAQWAIKRPRAGGH